MRSVGPTVNAAWRDHLPKTFILDDVAPLEMLELEQEPGAHGARHERK